MSLLPQRKKSAEEIAKLRENLGIPGIPSFASEGPPARESPEPTPLPVSASSAAEERGEVETPVQVAAGGMPIPIAPTQPQKALRSLKKSEQVPSATADHVGEFEPPTAGHPPRRKIVRSLRKSEQIPLTPTIVHPAPDDSKLPSQRHSDSELNEIRRQAALNMPAPAFNPALQIAHLALVTPGYLAVLGGALCFLHYEMTLAMTASCVGVALLIASFIFWKKPLSRHHAAFITVMALFVIVFGALHYFPQLRHGT